MKVTDKYVFFWKGILSNWAHTPYISKGLSFNCSEQEYMYRKAKYFRDEEIAKEILECEFNPKVVKALGRQVRNFSTIEWDKVKYDIMKECVQAKFMRNNKAKAELLKYPTQTFVEASPFDQIWGIGLEESNPHVNDPDYWRGQNLLGKCLTEVRDQLLKSSSLDL